MKRPVVPVVLLLAALFATAFVGVRAYRVHHDYDVWALAPGARTPTLPYHGRTYLRAAPGDLPGGLTILGSAPAGGQILGAPPVPGADPTVLYVRYPDGTVASYSLSGGP